LPCPPKRPSSAVIAAALESGIESVASNDDEIAQAARVVVYRPTDLG